MSAYYEVTLVHAGGARMTAHARTDDDEVSQISFHFDAAKDGATVNPADETAYGTNGYSSTYVATEVAGDSTAVEVTALFQTHGGKPKGHAKAVATFSGG